MRPFFPALFSSEFNLVSGISRLDWLVALTAENSLGTRFCFSRAFRICLFFVRYRLYIFTNTHVSRHRILTGLSYLIFSTLSVWLREKLHERIRSPNSSPGPKPSMTEGLFSNVSHRFNATEQMLFNV